MTNQRLYAVRGAVCCENNEKSISSWVPAMYGELLERNSIAESDVVSILFTVTDDLDAFNPATALRKAGFAASVPLMACAEPPVTGGLQRVMRILVTYYGSSAPIPVYMNGAEKLRPDLADGEAKSAHAR